MQGSQSISSSALASIVDFEEMRVDGKTIQAPALSFKNRRIVAAGKWVTMVRVKDEQVCEGELIDAPDELIAQLKRARFKADIFKHSEIFELLYSEEEVKKIEAERKRIQEEIVLKAQQNRQKVEEELEKKKLEKKQNLPFICRRRSSSKEIKPSTI